MYDLRLCSFMILLSTCYIYCVISHSLMTCLGGFHRWLVWCGLLILLILSLAYMNDGRSWALKYQIRGLDPGGRGFIEKMRFEPNLALILTLACLLVRGKLHQVWTATSRGSVEVDQAQMRTRAPSIASGARIGSWKDNMKMLRLVYTGKHSQCKQIHTNHLFLIGKKIWHK